MTATTLIDRMSALEPIHKTALAASILDRAEFDASLEAVAPELATDDDLNRAIEAAAAHPHHVLDTDASVAIADEFLRSLAQNPETAPILEHELASFTDDTQAVGAILAAGAAVSMIIFAAKTSVRYVSKDGRVTVSKKTASANDVRAASAMLGFLGGRTP